MSVRLLFPGKRSLFREPRIGQQSLGAEVQSSRARASLPASITRAASRQTYYTIRFLVDRDRVQNAYRTYAYFRWVDDCLDQPASERDQRLRFIRRQQALMSACYEGRRINGLRDEEQMLVDLIASDDEPDSGLRSYIGNMMLVMLFDAQRREQPISQTELDEYSRLLATAVTEAMHYFIGHDDASPQGAARYLAVTAAHITHMLRDTCEDTAVGYYNIPREYLESHGIGPRDLDSQAYRDWVKGRVQLARSCFEIGREYLAQAQNRRCRLAGYAYMARFEGVLDTIEAEDYWLRADYTCKRLDTARGALRAAVSLLFRRSPSAAELQAFSDRLT